jgi:ABC-type methionine transport system permease subunit
MLIIFLAFTSSWIIALNVFQQLNINVVPSKEPCYTPHLILNILDTFPFMLMVALIPFKNTLTKFYLWTFEGLKLDLIFHKSM